MARSGKNRRFAMDLICTSISICIFIFLSSVAWGAVAGSISGTVKDPSGRVVPNADVTVREVSTGIEHQTRSNGSGYYTLPVLPVGHYELQVHAPGFESYRREDIVLDTDSALTLDCQLEVLELPLHNEPEQAACASAQGPFWPIVKMRPLHPTLERSSK